MKEPEKRMEEMNYLKSLNYKKSNYEGVKVFYGDGVRAISVKPKFSINLTPGSLVLFTKKKTQEYIKHNLDFNQPAEIVNKTGHKIYLKLKDAILSNEKIGDLTYFVNPGKDPND
jgi:hypothetical protein